MCQLCQYTSIHVITKKKYIGLQEMLQQDQLIKRSINCKSEETGLKGLAYMSLIYHGQLTLVTSIYGNSKKTSIYEYLGKGCLL